MENINRKQPFMRHLAAELYGAVSCQARQFIFFEDFQIPDTPQGRFEMLALHLALMLPRNYATGLWRMLKNLCVPCGSAS